MRLREMLLGIAIGDAFGAGVEFQDRYWIRNNVDFTGFVNVRDTIKVPSEKLEVFTKNYSDWDYTDDTEMTIGVVKALLSENEFTIDLLLSKWQEEYDHGIKLKGFGRNGHGSMRWLYSGEMTIEQIRDFQRERKNPGNAPAMRSVPLGLLKEELINSYAEINANATHPNINAVISSQCIARSAEYLIVKKGQKDKIINYCIEKVDLNQEYRKYLREVNSLEKYEDLSESAWEVLCGKQPIAEPYFLPGIHGVPSDSKYTTGCALFVLKNSNDAMDALVKSVNLGGDVDSIASICTGILAGVKGLDSIPDFMLNNVEGVEYLEHLACDFKRMLEK